MKGAFLNLSRSWILCAFILLDSSCEQVQAREVLCQSAALVGGTNRSDYLAMDASMEASIGLIQVGGTQSDADAAGYCTGTLITEALVLTAAHCTVPTGEATITFPSVPTPILLEIVARHETEDLAVLRLAEPLAHGLSPIDVGTEPVAAGTLVQLAGYGADWTAPHLGLSFAASKVIRSGSRSFVVDAEGRAAACFGDSGGPAFVRTVDGHTAIVGVLKGGARGCGGDDVYVQLASTVEWLRKLGVPTGDSRPPMANCDLLGTRGRCYDQAALWCLDGRPKVEICETPRECAYDSDRGGYRCTSPELSACSGVGSFGVCEGDSRVFCEDGVVEVSPCRQCAASCAYSVRTGEAICNAEVIAP